MRPLAPIAVLLLGLATQGCSAPEHDFTMKDGWIADSAGRPMSRGVGKAFVDRIEPALAQGWAVRVPDHNPAEGIVVFSEGQAIAFAEPTIRRDDVAAALKNKRASKSGFSVALPRTLTDDQREALRYFAIFRKGEAIEFGRRGELTKRAPSAFTLSGNRLMAEDGKPYSPAASGAGWVDQIRFSEEGARIDGWAADPAAASVPLGFLFFVNGRLVAHAKPSVDRPDVARAYNAPGLTGSGFTVLLRKDHLKRGDALRVIAQFDGRRAVELSLSKPAAATLAR